MITEESKDFASYLIRKFKNINEFKSQSLYDALKSTEEDSEKKKQAKKDLKHLFLDQTLEESLLEFMQKEKDGLYGEY